MTNPSPTNPEIPSLEQSGTGKALYLRVWEMPEPEPRKWVIPEYVPEDAPTILYGDGGTAKSYMALGLATAVLTGREFWGVAVKQQRAVLYVDAELDDREFCRRAYAVARGLGLERPPKGLCYWRLPGSLMNGETRRQLSEQIQLSEATLTIVDSLTIGASGADVSESRVATNLMHFLETLGTVLAVDHVPKPAPGTNQSDSTIFGSAFKRHQGRSVLQVIRATGGGLLIRQTKTNFGPIAKPLTVNVSFEGDKVVFARVAADDPSLAGLQEHLPALERVAHALAADGPIHPRDLAEILGMEEKTVRNHLSTLRRLKRAEPVGNGQWQILGPPTSENQKSGEPVPSGVEVGEVAGSSSAISDTAPEHAGSAGVNGRKEMHSTSMGECDND